MKPSDFFNEEQDPAWSMNGEPWSSFRSVFDSDRVSRLRVSPEEGTSDLDAAYAMVRLAHGELEAFGTDGGVRLDDEEIVVLLRSLTAILRRLDIQFNPPFRDFKGFHGYWSANGMSGSWGARRGYLNELFSPVLSRLEDAQTDPSSIRGVDGELKNIIFASTGPKPEIVLRDAMNNVIEVVRNGEYCLVYDRPLTAAGLTWGELADWWGADNKRADSSAEQIKSGLYNRLLDSARGNPVEELVFKSYYRRFQGRNADTQPALLPQIYLHYDPLTAKERRLLGKPDRLSRERMDFLLLLPNGVRIVVEIDGKQHYANGDVASPKLYSEMMAEDRELRLRGYEVYRFGGHEVSGDNASAMLGEFFDRLEVKYGPLGNAQP